MAEQWPIRVVGSSGQPYELSVEDERLAAVEAMKDRVKHQINQDVFFNQLILNVLASIIGTAIGAALGKWIGDKLIRESRARRMR